MVIDQCIECKLIDATIFMCVLILMVSAICLFAYIMTDNIESREPDGGWSTDFLGKKCSRQFCCVNGYFDNKIITHSICGKRYPTSFHNGTYESCKKWLALHDYVDSGKCLGYQENIFIKKGSVMHDTSDFIDDPYYEPIKNYYVIVNRDPVRLNNKQ